jgi:hypothetical protein
VDQALAAIHQANARGLPLTLELRQHDGEVQLSCQCTEAFASTVRANLYAGYPDAKIEHVHEEPAPTHEARTWTLPLHLHPDIFPIRRYSQFEDATRTLSDPIAAVLATLSGNDKDGLSPSVQLQLVPARPNLRHRAERTLRMLATPFFHRHHRLRHAFIALSVSHWIVSRMAGRLLGLLAGWALPHDRGLQTTGSRTHEREDDLQAAADKLNHLLFEARLTLTVTGPAPTRAQARAKLLEMAGAFGQFSQPRLASIRPGRIRVSQGQRLWRGHPFLLSTEEAATLWHPPTVTVRAERMATVETREFEPPVNLPLRSSSPEVSLLGLATFRGRRQMFGILPDDRRRHIALLGKTGMGKSTLLRQLLTSDIAAGRGAGLIDPHGDLAEAVLAAVPKPRTNDVILFDAGDTSHPLSWNALYCSDTAQRPLVASGILTAFKKLYEESWGPRLEHILRNALLALLDIPGATLLSVLQLLSDARFRRQIGGRLSDPVVKAFWEQEFARLPLKLQIEAIAPIQNKVGAFVSSPTLRNILGQSRSSVDLRSVLDEGKVLIVNLSKGRIGDDASTLLGAFLVTSIQLAAMSRANVQEAERRDFSLYVDEFQNFATESFSTILSEARKYHLNLTVANQYLAQLDEQTLHAVFGNIGTLITFQVGAKDAEILSEQLAGDVLPEDLLRLPRYQAYARLLIDGHPSRPFSMRTLAPSMKAGNKERAEVIRRLSQQRYGRPLHAVETEIRARMGQSW